MDQQIFWNDLNPLDAQNLPDPPVFPSNANMAGEGSADFSMWSSSGPSSNRHPLNPSAREEVKAELGWASSPTINGGQGSGAAGRQPEATNAVLGLRTESSQAGHDRLLSQNPSGDDFAKNSGTSAAHDGTSSRAFESGNILRPNSSHSLGSLQLSSLGGSLNLHGSSSRGTGFLMENCEGRLGSLMDSQRRACKRKSIEEMPGQNSAGGSSSYHYQSDNSLVHSVPARDGANTALSISSSYNYPSGINPLSVPANAESSQRNCRVRFDTAQHDTTLTSHWVPGSSILPSDLCSTHQTSSLPIPFTQALDSGLAFAAGSSSNQPCVHPFPDMVPIFQPLSLNGASSSRISPRVPAIAGPRTGSLSSMRASTTAVQRPRGSSRARAMTAQRLIGLREDSSSRSRTRDNVSENLVFVPATDIGHSVEDPTSWGMANGSIDHVAPVSRTITTLPSNQLAGPTWIPHQNEASHYRQGLTEFLRRSSGSGLGTSLSQHSANPNTSQEITQQSTVAVRAHEQPYARSAPLMDRHVDGVAGIPARSLLAAREGRSRMFSEQIRNALQLIRGENVRLEQIRNALQLVREENVRLEELQDILLFDHSVFYGRAANPHDRHRDLRLDVDNMSYEELLALEERIGNVSTGLSEETVLKYLKQWKHVSSSEEIPNEVEPCCVCQEVYVEGEEIGGLNCGHDFHTDCIKQWLTQKNSCPICKTTGLDVEKRKKEAHPLP